MNPKIHNLDEQGQEPEYVELHGKRVDISFIPCGISIPMMNKYDEYFQILKSSKVLNDHGSINSDAEKELSKSTNKAAENLNKMIEIIALFTEHQDPEMDRKWIETNLTVNQVARFMSLLIQSITKGIKKSETKAEDKKKEVGSA